MVAQDTVTPPFVVAQQEVGTLPAKPAAGPPDVAALQAAIAAGADLWVANSQLNGNWGLKQTTTIVPRNNSRRGFRLLSGCRRAPTLP
jgi:hypothetical protein